MKGLMRRGRYRLDEWLLRRRLSTFAEDDNHTPFPDPESALTHPNGLLALGGNLSPRRLELAYRNGIFPYFQNGESLRWWSPDPRAILFPERIRISTTLRRRIRQAHYTVTFDRAFDRVIQHCGALRTDVSSTWIDDRIVRAYQRMYAIGRAHSMEVWRGNELVGGCYGVAYGGAFFGESMFSHASDASKVALVYQARQLERWGFKLIDCQFPTPHLSRMGAEAVPRTRYLSLLREALLLPDRPAPWRFDADFDPLLAPRPNSASA